MPEGELRAVMESLLGRYGQLWSKRFRDEPGGAGDLLAEALDRLEDMGLVRRHAEGIEPRPAIGRYRILEPAPREVRDE